VARSNVYVLSQIWTACAVWASLDLPKELAQIVRGVTLTNDMNEAIREAGCDSDVRCKLAAAMKRPPFRPRVFPASTGCGRSICVAKPI